MNPLYLRAQTTVLDKFKAFGQPVTFTRKQDGEFDPVTGKTSPSTLTYDGWMITSEYTAQERAAGALIQQSGTALIQQGDIKIKLAAKDLVTTPTTGDVMTTATGDYRILSVTPISPAGLPLLYELQGRQ